MPIEDSTSADPAFFDLTGNLQMSVGPAQLVGSGILAFDDQATAGVDEAGWAVSASATMDFGPLMVSATGVYSDDQNHAWHGSHPLTAPFLNGAGIDSWGAGGSVTGPLTETVNWHAGGSYSSKNEGAVDFNVIYATGSLEWSPMPQYTIVGQAVYEKANNDAAGLDGNAWSFLNYWMYKF